MNGLLALVASAAVAAVPAASSESARLALNDCLSRLNPEIDIGYERISARCPDLARRVEASTWSVWLPRDWKRPGNDLSAGGLRQLGELVASTDGASSAGTRQLNVTALPGVLASLVADSAAESHGWWTRTKAWLRDVFERGEEEDSDWFSRFVARNGLSQVALELVSYVALALVVVLAVIIVVNELRVSGLFRRRLTGRRSGGAGAAAVVGVDGGAGPCRTLADVQKADPALQPGLLLELITWRLTEAGRLPQSRSLTIRELTRAALLSEEGDRERLAELARMSERMRFSDGPVSGADVAAALQGGRVLLERVSAGGGRA